MPAKCGAVSRHVHDSLETHFLGANVNKHVTVMKLLLGYILGVDRPIHGLKDNYEHRALYKVYLSILVNKHLCLFPNHIQARNSVRRQVQNSSDLSVWWYLIAFHFATPALAKRMHHLKAVLIRTDQLT